MKNKVILMIVAASVMLILGNTPLQAETGLKALVTTSSMMLNGEPIQCSGFNIGGSNYFRLRDLALQLNGTTSAFEVTWNSSRGAIEIETGKNYTPVNADATFRIDASKDYEALPSGAIVLVDGIVRSVEAYNIEGSNYFKLRDLGAVAPFEVRWDAAANAIWITTPQASATQSGMTGGSASEEAQDAPEDGVEEAPTGDPAEDGGEEAQEEMPAAIRLSKAFASGDNSLSWEFPRWQEPVKSYLINGGSEVLSVLSAPGGVTIEHYNDDGALSATKRIGLELPIFGGFFSGTRFNYIVYGQENRDEQPEREVIRIVRYDKQFNRIDSVSITGESSYTVSPFYAGSARMAEYGNTLVLHTARLRYLTSDGYNHQSQLTIIVNTDKMQVVNMLGAFQLNHVSHSFDQYVLFDGAAHVLLDHGDSYPRALVLHKWNGSGYDAVNLFDIPGQIGDNATGMTVGGFEGTSSHYMAAFNTIDHSRIDLETAGGEINRRDIMLAVIPKNSISQDQVKHITLAAYTGTDRYASVPKLVRVSGDKLAVLWQEFDSHRQISDLRVAMVDGRGQLLEDIRTVEGFVLSEAQPVVDGDSLVWITDRDNTRTLYALPM